MLRPIAPAVRHTLALVALAALAACGGGGGSDSPSTSGTTAAQVTVQGVAAKGLLQKAKVEVLQVNANGSTTLLKEGTTDDKGGYSLTGIPAGTAVVVRVSAVAGTKMVDEATGDTLDAPVGFVMRAATVTQEGGTNALQITPFSEMAVAKAEASGGLSANNIEAANADVRTYLGFDVLAEKPEFSGTNPQNKAALAVAAISQLANTPVAASGLGCADTKQEDRVKCVVGKMAQKGTDDTDLGTSIETAKQKIKGDKNYTGEVPPAPQPQPETLLPAPTRTAVTEAKALIANIRSNGPFLGGSGADTLDKRLNSTADTLRDSSSPVGDGSQELFKRVLGAAAALDSKDFTLGVFEVPTEAANVARCTFFKNATDPTDNTPADDVASANAIGCRLTYGGRVIEDGVNYAYQQGLRIMPTATKGTYTVITQVVKQRLIQEKGGEFTNDTSLPAYTVRLPAGSSVLLGQVSLKRDANANLNGFTLSGDYATSVYNVVNGLATRNTITASVVPAAVGALTQLSVSGVFTSSGGSLPGATVQLAPGSYFQTSFAQPGNVISSTETDQLSRAAHLILSGSVGTASVTGTLDINGFKAPKVAPGNGSVTALPTQVSFNGVIKQSASVTLFDGTLAASATSLSDFDATLNAGSSNQPTNPQVSFVGKLYVPSRPLMQVNLALTKPSRTVTAVSGQYVQDATTVLISAQRNTQIEANNYVNLATPSGVNLRIKPNVPRSLLTKSEVTIGVYDADKSRIDYADGSFQQY
jgi:hypothetical protein